MSEKRDRQLDVIGLAQFGFFLILVGLLFTITPNLTHRIYEFLRDFRLRELSPNVSFPIPQSNHPLLYTAVSQFCLAFGVFQAFVLGARFLLKDSIDRKAGTASSLIFWLGASLIVSYLAAGTLEWFVFISWLVMLGGFSIVIVNIIVLLAHGLRKGKSSPSLPQ